MTHLLRNLLAFVSGLALCLGATAQSSDIGNAQRDANLRSNHSLPQAKGLDTYVDYQLEWVGPFNPGLFDAPDHRYLSGPEKGAVVTAFNFYVGGYGKLRKLQESCTDYDSYVTRWGYRFNRKKGYTHTGKALTKEQVFASVNKLVKALKTSPGPDLDLEKMWAAGYDSPVQCNASVWYTNFGHTVRSVDELFFLLKEATQRPRMADFYPAGKQAAAERFATTVGRAECVMSVCEPGTYTLERVAEGADGRLATSTANIKAVRTTECSMAFSLEQPSAAQGAGATETVTVDWTKVRGTKLVVSEDGSEVLHIVGPFLARREALRIVSTAAPRTLAGAGEVLSRECAAPGVR